MSSKIGKRRIDKLVQLEKKRKKLVIIVLAIIFLVAITIYIITPKIYLNGKKIVTINYNETYEDLGSTGKYLNKDVTDKINVSGEVNTKKVGTYKIKYNLKVSFWNITKTRVIKVVDSKKPKIKLEGDKKLNICPNGKFEEIGYSAIDEYDGDLTKKVKVTVKEDKVIYEVSDNSNNKVKVERKLIRQDNEKPVIELKGSDVYYHKLNDAFKEPGYTVSDNCDKNLENSILVEGSVDVSKEGSYTLTYTVKDSSDNTTKVTRTVNVFEKTDPNSGITKKGVVYLTFDDGPSSSVTTKILDILKEENVKATFFVTNFGPDNLIKRAYDEGHVVALHTASHDYKKVYSSVENYFADLKEVSDRVEKITGEKSMIIRFPGGSNNSVSKKYSQGIMTTLTDEVFNRGYRYYDWNVDANDAWSCAKNNVSDKKSCVYNNVVNNLSKNRANIVLMHDNKEHTASALRDIIKYGKENGYTFETITSNTAMIRFKVIN